MKTIFILPALPAFVAAIELGVARLFAWGVASSSAVPRRPRRLAVRSVILALVLLVAGYFADLSVLAAQLAEDRAAGVPPAQLRTEPPSPVKG